MEKSPTKESQLTNPPQVEATEEQPQIDSHITDRLYRAAQQADTGGLVPRPDKSQPKEN